MKTTILTPAALLQQLQLEQGRRRGRCRVPPELQCWREEEQVGGTREALLPLPLLLALLPLRRGRGLPLLLSLPLSLLLLRGGPLLLPRTRRGACASPSREKTTTSLLLLPSRGARCVLLTDFALSFLFCTCK